MSEPKLVASSKVRGKAWRKRLPTTLVALGCVAAVGAALTAAVSPVPGLDFLPSGHWVFNTVTQLAVHIDGGSPSVDASVSGVDAGPDSQVVQGPDTGYVISQGEITVFGKSSLSVEEQIDPKTTEPPIAIEAVGGPYLFYQDSGKVMRLGDAPAAITTGKFVDQVITPDGTIWLYKEDGNLCPLGRTAVRIGSCPATIEKGHGGALTVVGTQPEFLDTTSDVLSPVSDKGLGAGQGVGFQVSPDAQLASSDVDGRVAIIDPGTHQMHLIYADEPSRDPKAVDLGAGTFTPPTSTGSVVAVVNQDNGVVRTYGSDGAQQHEAKVPKRNDGDKPRVSKGEDNRVYVENGAGTDVVVVGQEGEISTVPAAVAPQSDPKAPKAKPGQNETPVPGTTPPLPDRDERATPPPSNRVPDVENEPTPPDKPERTEPPTVPASPPGAPADVQASAGDASATVQWGLAAANQAAITSYRVTWTGGGSMTVSASARSAKITGLTNGTRYTISVAAANSVGRGPAASAAPVTPVAGAAAPGGLTVTPTGTDASVSWTKPNLAGGTLKDYKVTATGQSTKTVAGTSTSFSGLVPGSSLTVTVRAETTTPDGRTLTGAAATRTVSVPSGVVTVRRGAECDSPWKEEGNGQCTKMHVVLTGFQPDTLYEVTAHSDADATWSNERDTRTESDGGGTFDAFDYYGVDRTVWITVNEKGGPQLAESKHYLWEPV